MKRLLTLLCITLFAIQLMANPVTLPTAKHIAAKFFTANSLPATDDDIQNLTPDETFRHLYILGIHGQKGFIILSADNRALPLLGYSLTNQFSSDTLPDHIKEWLLDYEEQITLLITDNIEPTPDIQQQWTELTESDQIAAVKDTVGPLLTTTWHQSPYYNNYCPMVNSKRTITGCVATATAQIMKYHNHPTTGIGTHSYKWNGTTLTADFGNTTYDWANMPDSLSNTSTTTEINAVATLMYHIGVAVEMEYGTSSSNAYTYYNIGNAPSAESALQVFFKYSNQICNIYRSEISDSLWKATLKEQLDNSLPILYSGRQGNSGHAFVCDGYTTNDYFHFNFGWGGRSDGFYLIGSLAPGYNSKNVAVINIKPIKGSLPAQTIVTASADDPSHGTFTGTGTYTPVDTIELTAWANDGYLFDHWDNNSRYNPLYTYATTPTYSRTAYYTPLPTDTLHYCNGPIYAKFGQEGASTLAWGIRYPANIIPANRALDAVQLYSYDKGEYITRIYQGDTTEMALMLADTFQVTTTGWVSHTLATPYPIDTTKSLWITFQHSGTGYYVAVTSEFKGSPDCLYFYEGDEDGWLSYPLYGLYYTLMIKGIISPSTQTTTLQFTNTVSQDWSDPSNWNLHIVPNSVTDVTINATCTIPDNYTAYARNLTLNNQLVIMPSGALNVENTLTNNATAGNLQLKASSTSQATLLFTKGAPQATVENSLRGTTHTAGGKSNPDWQYRGFIGKNPSLTNWNSVILSWNEKNNQTNCWTLEYDKSGTFKPSPWVGYSIANYGNADDIYDYTTTLLCTDSATHTYTLTRTGTKDVPNRGVNLITNSHSAPIDMRSDSITFGSNVEQTFYFFNTRNYLTYKADSAGSIVTYPYKSGELLTLSPYIPAGQSFAVKTNADNETLTIGRKALHTSASGRMYTPAQPHDINILEITISTSLDRLTLIEHPSCTSGFDNGYDGTKFLQSNAPQIFAANTFGKTAVNCDQTLLGQKIGCTTPTDTPCTLTFNASRVKTYDRLYLYDRVTHLYTDLLNTKEYRFTPTASDTARFELVGQRNSDTEFITTTNCQLEIAGNRALASGFTDPSLIIRLSDINGTTLWSDKIGNGPWFTLPTDLPSGIYILHCNKVSVKWVKR